MSYLLKDLYSPAFYNRFADVLTTSVPSFNKSKFIKAIYNDGFANMELKQRMKHTTKVLHGFFPEDYKQSVKLIEVIINKLREIKVGEDSLPYMLLPDYIETYGLDDYKTSIKALEFITQFVSCEFAVRPFLIKYGDKMLAQMTVWSKHKSYKVRRFASEGSRPRLPWAMAVPALKQNPEVVIPLLENLMNDPHEWVRKSVANNINDIAKTHPEIVLAIAKKWKGFSKETDAIIKHGSRTLLKKGHADILNHYGLNGKNIELDNLKILTLKVKVGDALAFSFSIKNNNKTAQTVRLEYAIYYRMKNGLPSKKVYKISERILQKGEALQINRKQSFKLITTRTFYNGVHQLGIIINGEEKAVKAFELLPG